MRSILPIFAAALLVGCETQSVSRVGEEPRAAISYAATARYPGEDRALEDGRIAAVDDPKEKRLHLLNVSDTSIPPATVWVNGLFLKRIDSIPPRATITIEHDDLLESGPGVRDLASLDQPVTRVEIETHEGLFRVKGPARQ